MGEQLRANIHTEETESIMGKRRFTVCTYRYSGNTALTYLFSNHLGLPVNLLPIGHIAQEVMALRSWEGDLFGCFFEALLRSAPQDHLADRNIFTGQDQRGTSRAPKLCSALRFCHLFRKRMACFNSQSSTRHYVCFAQFLWQWDPLWLWRSYSSNVLFIQRTERPFSLQQIVFRARLKARGLLCELSVSSSTGV